MVLLVPSDEHWQGGIYQLLIPLNQRTWRKQEPLHQTRRILFTMRVRHFPIFAQYRSAMKRIELVLRLHFAHVINSIKQKRVIGHASIPALFQFMRYPSVMITKICT